MEIVIIATVFVIIGIITGVIALAVVLKNKKVQRLAPVETVTATVLGAFSQIDQSNQNYTSGTVDSTGANETKEYSVAFSLTDGQKMTFRMKKKAALALHDGDRGQLTFKGYKFIDFVVTEKTNMKVKLPFFVKGINKMSSVKFYGESKHLGVAVASRQAIDCDLSDIQRLIQRLPEDKTDWFFVLKRKDGTKLQAEKESDGQIKCTIQTAENETVQLLGFIQLSDYLDSFFY
jgi:hypothetical protein